MRYAPLLAALFAVLVGTVTDKTTGQPLSGVTVTLQNHGRVLHAQTANGGHFRFAGLPDGRYAVRVGSADVPPKTVDVSVKGRLTRVTIRACSTTLDYSCAPFGGG